MTDHNICPSCGSKMRVRRKAISPKWRLECRCGTSGPWATAPDKVINWLPPLLIATISHANSHSMEEASAYLRRFFAQWNK